MVNGNRERVNDKKSLLNFDEFAHARRIALTTRDGLKFVLFKFDQVAAIEMRLDLLDLVGIDDVLAVNTQEVGGEAFFEKNQRIIAEHFVAL